MPMDGSALNMDQTQYMAPMDLYASIWGTSFQLFTTKQPLTTTDSPSSWNSGNIDALNFDFLAQPPPGQPNQQYYF